MAISETGFLVNPSAHRFADIDGGALRLRDDPELPEYVFEAFEFTREPPD